MACLWGFRLVWVVWEVTMGWSPALASWPGHGSPDHGGGGQMVTRQWPDSGQVKPWQPLGVSGVEDREPSARSAGDALVRGAGDDGEARVTRAWFWVSWVLVLCTLNDYCVWVC